MSLIVIVLFFSNVFKIDKLRNMERDLKKMNECTRSPRKLEKKEKESGKNRFMAV